MCCVVWTVLLRTPKIYIGRFSRIILIWRGFTKFKILIFILSGCPKAIDVTFFGFVIPAGESTMMVVAAPIFALLKGMNSSKLSFLWVIV